jgi:hypothetical protein
MKKSRLKKFKELADTLPPMVEGVVRGWEPNDEGMQPIVEHIPVNHERRLRKAYESNGVEGVGRYLDLIKKSQQERNARAKQDSVDTGE